MKDHPMALYDANLRMEIADDEEEETELRAAGYMEYADAKKANAAGKKHTSKAKQVRKPAEDTADVLTDQK